jgi:hypothetical protein
MDRHFHVLAILWLVTSALMLIPGVALMGWSGWGFPVHRVWHTAWPFVGFLGGVLSLAAVLGLVTGWGLMERQSWARPLAIALAIFSLLKFPLGTALGVYTLWALAGARGSAEYERLSRG